MASSPTVDRRILADALADLEKRRQKQALRPRPAVWRIVMKSKMVKLAAAAVLVVALLLGLHFLGSPLGSGVTFAQVIQPILNANTAIFDIIIGVEDANVPVIHDMIMGSRIRRTLANVPGDVSIIDLVEGKILSLNDAKKEAIFYDLKGLPPIPNYLENLKGLFTKLQEIPHFAVQDLGMQEVDGRKAVGFLAKHPSVEITLWADAKTGLPIRIDQKEKQMTAIVKNMRFDVPMDEALFSMDVPAGYQRQQVQLDLFGSTEADFLAGLRIRAEMFGDGQFPDSLAFEDYMKQVPEIIKKVEALKLSAEQNAELEKTMGAHLLFLRMFKGEGKWYYRGKGVRLGAADKPIFWYRPKGSETYRVIYGDLHVGDAARENLPEPLAADDVPAGSLGFQQWSQPDFVGTQEDRWHIAVSGPITVQSELTLMKGPQGVSVMPIALPYATGVLTSVSLSDTPVPFELTGAGQYQLQLPIDKLLAGQTKITCTWTLVLPDLGTASQNVPLKSLVPVVAYKLTVTVDAASGWQYGKDSAQSSWVPFFSTGNPEPRTAFGTCGLGLQKRQ
ncbi:MAG: hypothetical protein MUC88_07050 [Planctomycetes bacterium]|jgi:hypothetical protein|nr:hypothetical protein [Planctomycetota bacterium]